MNFAVFNDYNANLIPRNVSDEQGAMVEPAAVALYGVDRANIKAGGTVLATGAGPIGALIVLICGTVGASTIFISEPNANRRRLVESPAESRDEASRRNCSISAQPDMGFRASRRVWRPASRMLAPTS